LLNSKTISFILLYSFFARTALAGYKVYYLDLAITLVLGFRILLTKPYHITRKTFEGKVYNYCRVAFVFLLFLIIPYYLLFEANSSNIAKRSVNELLCDIVVYMYFFVYLGNLIKDRLQLNQSIYKIIMAYAVVYYVYYNINSFMIHGKVAHNAYYACLGLILLSNVLYKLFYTKIKKWKLFYVSAAITLTVMPILAILRGATATMVVIYFVMLVFRRRKIISTLVQLSAILLVIIVILSRESVLVFFEESNDYGYSRPEEMLSAYTETDANRDIRVDWFELAFDSFMQNPLIGSAYSFGFDPFDRSHFGGGYALHNYYAAILVDAGFLLILFYISIFFKVILISIKFRAQNNTEIPKYLGWTVAVISTNATNAYGHIWHISLAMHLILAYAILKLIKVSNRTY